MVHKLEFSTAEKETIMNSGAFVPYIYDDAGIILLIFYVPEEVVVLILWFIIQYAGDNGYEENRMR